MRSVARVDKESNLVVGLIPARYHSTRFEGKPLKEILGLPMIHRVYNQATQSKLLDSVIVLTDDTRISHYCSVNDMRCVVIDEECRTGTDRCAKALDLIDGDIFVNIQGDEPLIDPEAIDTLIHSHSNNGISNAYVELDFYSDKRHDNNVVKVVTDSYNNAIYYSRLSIPYYQKEETIVKQQLGLYAFHREFLHMFPKLPVRDLEKSESVEMLRYVENGYKVHMVKVEDEGYSVDTPDDLVIVEEILRKRLC